MTYRRFDTKWELIHGVRQGNVQKVKEALERGGDPNITFPNRHSALFVAAQQDNPTIVDLLWLAGGTLNLSDQKELKAYATVDADTMRGHARLVRHDAAQFKDSRGTARLLQLVNKDTIPSEQSLWEEYNVQFDLELHRQQLKYASPTSAISKLDTLYEGKIKGAGKNLPSAGIQ